MHDRAERSCRWSRADDSSPASGARARTSCRLPKAPASRTSAARDDSERFFGALQRAAVSRCSSVAALGSVVHAHARRCAASGARRCIAHQCSRVSVALSWLKRSAFSVCSRASASTRERKGVGPPGGRSACASAPAALPPQGGEPDSEQRIARSPLESSPWAICAVGGAGPRKSKKSPARRGFNFQSRSGLPRVGNYFSGLAELANCLPRNCGASASLRACVMPGDQKCWPPHPCPPGQPDF